MSRGQPPRHKHSPVKPKMPFDQAAEHLGYKKKDLYKCKACGGVHWRTDGCTQKTGGEELYLNEQEQQAEASTKKDLTPAEKRLREVQAQDKKNREQALSQGRLPSALKDSSLGLGRPADPSRSVNFRGLDGTEDEDEGKGKGKQKKR